MPSTTIVVDVAGESAGVPGVSRVFDYSHIDALTPVVTVTLAVTTGVTQYFWELVDVPEGSSAVLSDPTVAAPTFSATPFAYGTYLIRCTINGGQSAGKIGLAYSSENYALRKLAAHETLEFSYSRGWTEAHNDIIDALETGGGAGTLQAAYNGGDTINTTGTSVKINIPDTMNSSALVITNNNVTDKPSSLEIVNNAAPSDYTEAPSLYLSGSASYHSIAASGALFIGSDTSVFLGTRSTGATSVTVIDSITQISGTSQVDLNTKQHTLIELQETSAGVQTIMAAVDGSGSIITLDSEDNILHRFNLTDTYSGGYIISNDTDPMVSMTAVGALTLNSLGSAAITLDAAGTIELVDGYHAASTWVAASMPFSSSSAEWSNIRTTFGEVSLLNALAQAGASGGATTFVALTDTPNPLVNPNALIVTNGLPTPNGLSESPITTGYATNAFTFYQGTTNFTVSADCVIDQDLQISASPNWANIEVGSGTPTYVDLSGGDAYVTDDLEVGGNSNFTGHVWTRDLLLISEGVSNGMYFSDTTATTSGIRPLNNYQVNLFVGARHNNVLAFTNQASANLYHGHGVSTDPLWAIHSSTLISVDDSQYVSLHHDISHGRIQTGTGNLTVGSGTTIAGLASNGDLVVSSRFEALGLSYFNSELQIESISAPGTVADKLYNLSGVLYWYGSPLVSSSSSSLWVQSSNIDVDTGTEVVDSFAVTEDGGAMWIINVSNGVNHRCLSINCSWDYSANTVVDSGGIGTVDAGTVDVTFTVTMSGGTVTLSAVATSDNWVVSATRGATI